MIEHELSRYFAASAPPGVVGAWLFGSRAAGRGHRESDVDIAVLADFAVHPDRESRGELRVRLGSELIAALGHNAVDVVVLNDVSPELGAKVVNTGARVFCADAGACHTFVRDVQLLAGDLAPWLERMRRLKLEALRR